MQRQGFTPEEFKRAMAAAFQQAGVREVIDRRRREQATPIPNELDDARRDLRRVGERDGGVSLGPLDVSGNKLWRTSRMAGHQFAEIVERQRRGLLILRSRRTDSPVAVGDFTYARRSMIEWATVAAMVCEGLGPNDRELVVDIVRSLYDNWRDAPNESENDRVGHANQTFQVIEGLGDRRVRSASRKGMNVYAQAFEGLGEKVKPSDYDKRMGRIPGEVKKLKRGLEQLFILYHGCRNRRKKKELRRKIESRVKRIRKLESIHRSGDSRLSTFAYRMNPTVRRDAQDGNSARLSLNMDVGEGGANARKMYGAVSKGSRLISQSKIMGPANIGKRVDDGVIYLRRPGLRVAEAVSGELGLTGPRQNATPPGMEPISRGVGYAEYTARDMGGGSHGESRGAMVTNAVMARLGGDMRPMAEILGEVLERKGYDPIQPSFIDTKDRQWYRAYIRALKENLPVRPGMDDDDDFDYDEDDSWIDQ
ncbi:T3SS effector HopA1 family protein [Pseudenhygromyxa sp. WMMC2535]|uniref:T3SS effector HopA1 family protein n=1 Tax=Pseudenhygromyxa sp. WMMC2535 TaxID=2712867 RepID=UPI0031F7F18E